MSVSGQPLARRTLLGGTGAMAALAAAAAACGSSGGSKDISQWYHEYGEAGTEDAAKKFGKAYKKRTVNVTWVKGGDQYGNKLATGLLGNKGPDTFETQLTAQMVKSKQLVALDDLIADVKSDFHPADLALGTVSGKLYGIPMIQDMQMLYYRKSLLSKAGLKPPTTVEELFAAAKELSTGSQKGLYLGSKQGADLLGGPALFSAGLDYVTPDHKVGFDDPRAAEALDKLRGIGKQSWLLNGYAQDWSDPTAFIKGATAMQWTGLWNMKLIVAKWGDDVGVAAYPALDAKSKPAVPIGDWLAMVSAKSKKIDDTKAFVKWLWVEQTQFQQQWALDFGFHLPVRDSIAAKATQLQKGQAAEAVALSKQYAHPASPPDWTSKMSSAYTDAMTNIITKGDDPEGQLKGVVSTVKSELDKLYG
jgi:multiple sugar transport system substrate-binding protein